MVLKFSYDFWEAAAVRCAKSLPYIFVEAFSFSRTDREVLTACGRSSLQISHLPEMLSTLTSWICHRQYRCSINGTYTHFIDWTFSFVITNVYFTCKISSLGHSVLEEFLKACQLILPLIAGLVINSFFNGDERSH